MLDYIEEHDLVRRAKAAGQLLRSELEGLREIPGVGDVRGLGLMQGIEFVADTRTREPFEGGLRLAGRIAAAAMGRGLVLNARTGTVDGLKGDHIFVTPPLTSQDDEIAAIASMLRDAIRDVLQDLPASIN